MTKQTPDWIILNDRREPLSGSTWPFPPDFKLPEEFSFKGLSTAHQRGFGALWWLVADTLFLKDVGATVVTRFDPFPRSYSMQDLLKTEGPISAEWFTGNMYIGVREPHHKRVEPEYLVFDRYRKLTFSSGRRSDDCVVSASERRAAARRRL
jgi:hypothetical protein